MIFKKTNFFGLIIIETCLHVDERGEFQETFRLNELENNLGENFFFCQENQSKSKRNVLRGLHFQKEPYSQAKLIRVLEGKIIDVVVDLRKNSPTFGEHFKIELSSKNNLQLFIPKGFAHGYLTLSETAKIIYKVDNYFNKPFESGLKYNDKFLNIDWGLDSDIIISTKDNNQPLFKDIKF